MASDVNTQKLQIMLLSLGYNPGPLDGVIGSKTNKATSEFQEAYELDLSGWADQDTVDTMYNAFLEEVAEVYPAVLQLLLFYAGYSPGAIDGAIGKKTINAIYRFQEDNGLDATGDCDEDTLQLLKQCMYGAE